MNFVDLKIFSFCLSGKYLNRYEEIVSCMTLVVAHTLDEQFVLLPILRMLFLSAVRTMSPSLTFDSCFHFLS